MVSRLLVRADGYYELGYGHIMRTVALAEAAVAAGMSATFVGQADDGALALLDARGFGMRPTAAEWPALVDDDTVVVVDATVADDELRAARDRSAALALLDDDASTSRPVDLVIAPDLTSVPEGLAMPVLTGWEYALVREEFRVTRAAPTGDGLALMALFGGTDPTGAGQSLLDRLAELAHLGPFATITLVEGPGSVPVVAPRWTGPGTIEVVRNPPDLVERMMRTDAAITAGSTTMLELAALGIPMAVSAVVTEQQDACAQMVVAGALRVDLKLATGPESVGAVLRELGNPTRAAEIAAGMRSRIDGLGAQRVVDAILRVADDQNR